MKILINIAFVIVAIASICCYAAPVNENEAENNLLTALQDQEKLIKTQIEDVKLSKAADPNSELPNELLDILLAQLEIMQAQINHFILIQKEEQKIRDGIQKDSVRSSVVNGEVQTLANDELKVEQSSELLANLLAQRDLLNLQIEKVDQILNITETRNDKNVDIKSSLVAQRDLLSLQINHILATPGFENKVSGHFQILGTPNRNPVSETPKENPQTTVNNVQSGVKTVETDSSDITVEKPLNTLSVLQAQKDVIEKQIMEFRNIQNKENIEKTTFVDVLEKQKEKLTSEIENLKSTENHENSEMINTRIESINFPTVEVTESPEKSIDTLAVLLAQKKLVEGQIDYINSIQEVERQLRNEIIKAGMDISSAGDSSQLLNALQKQKEALDDQIQFLSVYEPPKIIHTGYGALGRPYGVVVDHPDPVSEVLIVEKEAHVIVPQPADLLNVLLAQRDEIERTVITLRDRGTKQDQNDLESFLNAQRNFLDDRIEEIRNNRTKNGITN